MPDGTLFTFIHTPAFVAKAKKLISDEVQREIETLICENPTRGELQAGVRKMRVSLDEGQGKSGGARVVYYYIERRSQVYLITAFPKNAKSSLTKDERNALGKLVKLFEKEGQ